MVAVSQLEVAGDLNSSRSCLEPCVCTRCRDAEAATSCSIETHGKELKGMVVHGL